MHADSTHLQQPLPIRMRRCAWSISLFPTDILAHLRFKPGWKGLHRTHTVCNEIAHSCEPRVHLLLAHHFTPPPHKVQWMRSTLAYHTYYSVSHFLCALPALGNATCITLNSMFVTSVSAHKEHAIIQHRGWGDEVLAHNFHMVWCANITDFRE